MRVISIKHIRDFYETHPDAEESLKAWLSEVQKATWDTPQDIKDQYSSASFLANKRVVFNIKGNSFRLVVAVAYKFSAVYVKFIGTHAEYDEINAVTVEMK
jgi:mRNA interferase HigB